MKNILNKKLNKKGFTLAELLIVVAIIAILVAIALPLFFGALDNAREQTFNANKRSVKAAGVTYILNNSVKPDDDGKYTITGTVAANGDITKVEAKTHETSDVESEYGDGKTWDGTKEATIIVIVEDTDVTEAAGG